MFEQQFLMDSTRRHDDIVFYILFMYSCQKFVIRLGGSTFCSACSRKLALLICLLNRFSDDNEHGASEGRRCDLCRCDDSTRGVDAVRARGITTQRQMEGEYRVMCALIVCPPCR